MEQDEQKPTLKIRTDDDDGITSWLTVTVDKSLARAVFKHTVEYDDKDYGKAHDFHVFPFDLHHLAKFLDDAAWWMESGYKDKKKPDGRDYT